MDGKVCAGCGTTVDLAAVHPTVKTKCIWTKNAEYRDSVLAECRVLCRKCRVPLRAPAKPRIPKVFPQVACECGCGTMIASRVNGVARQYVYGHSSAPTAWLRRRAQVIAPAEPTAGHELVAAEDDDGWHGWCGCGWMAGPKRIRRLIEVIHRAHVSEAS